MDGRAVGDVGTLDGSPVGEVGLLEGRAVGCIDTLGVLDGCPVGNVGILVGWLVGCARANPCGRKIGLFVLLKGAIYIHTQKFSPRRNVV